MIYTFSFLFLAIIILKLWLVYQNYSKTKKNLSEFCLLKKIDIPKELRFMNFELPEIKQESWKIQWKKQGKGRSYHHVLKIYYEFQNHLPKFQLVSKNILPKLNAKEDWKEMESNLFSNSKWLQTKKTFLERVVKLQKEYGWGILEVNENLAFYTIIAEPWEKEAWKHLEGVLDLMKKLEEVCIQ